MHPVRFAAQYLQSSVFALLCGVFLAPAVHATPTEQQRKIFLSVYRSVERGSWAAVDALPAERQLLLQSYVLWPDLRAAWFRANLDKADHAEIDAFLEQYGVLKPARDLRYRYALHLARTGDLATYLSIYQQFYQGLEIAKLDCIALRAEIDAGRGPRIVNRAVDLWKVGESQVDECDPVFELLVNQEQLEVTHYIERFELAIDAREFSMARWLGKSIDQRHIDIAGQWLQAQRNPESFVQLASSWSMRSRE